MSMFEALFESQSQYDDAAAMLAVLTVTPQDQVAAVSGIFGTDTAIFEDEEDWRSLAAAAFIRASSFISSDLVDAVLDSGFLAPRLALVDRHELFSSDVLSHVCDSDEPDVAVHAAAAGLLSAVPMYRLQQFLDAGSSQVTNLVLSSELVSVEFLRAALEVGAYSPAWYGAQRQAPDSVFEAVVDRLGLDVVASVIREAPPSFWWVPLLESYGFDVRIVQQFFTAVFAQFETELQSKAGGFTNAAVLRALISMLRTGLTAVEESGRFPTLFEPAAQPALPDSAPQTAPAVVVYDASFETLLRQSSASQPEFVDVLLDRLLTSLATSSGSSVLFSKRFQVTSWILNASVAEMVAAWRSGQLSYDVVVMLIEADLPTCWDALSFLLESLCDEASFVDTLPDLYVLLLRHPNTYVALNKVRVVAQLMPFEMQVSSLMLKDLAQHVDLQKLLEWRRSCEGLSFAMIPPVVSDDVPLAVVAAIATIDDTLSNSASSTSPADSSRSIPLSES